MFIWAESGEEGLKHGGKSPGSKRCGFDFCTVGSAKCQQQTVKTKDVLFFYVLDLLKVRDLEILRVNSFKLLQL